MSMVESGEFADATTAAVLGVAEVCAGLDLRWSRGRALVAHPRSFMPGEGAEWSEEVRRLRSVEDWLETADALAVHAAFEQLPDMLRPFATLDSLEPLDEVGLFEVKRFLYWARVIVGHVASRLDTFEENWGDFLAQTMRALHPEKQPSPRFHLSADLDPRLAAVRDQIRKLKKLEKKQRDAIEAAIVADHGGTFDVRGRYRPPAGSTSIDDARLRRDGARWDLSDPALDELQEALTEHNEEMWVIEAELMAALTERLRPMTATLQRICHALAELDVRIAKVGLRQQWEGVWGAWSDDVTTLRDGKLPRLLESLPDDEIQPISIELDERPAVLTGPNMGGKSALLELVGIAQWCGQHAFPIPAKEFRFRPVASIVYVGAEEPHSAGATGLSAFGREVRRLVDFWGGEAPRMWLLDELGRGTHPDEGASIAIHVIRRRQRAGDRILAATHFPAVASLAEAAHFRIAGLDPKKTLEALADAPADLPDIEAALREAMDYRALVVQPGREAVPRDAWLIARILGLESDES